MQKEYSDVLCLSCIGITLLLSMTVFQLIIAEKVPESSQAIPLIGTLVLMLNFVENNFSFSSPTTLHCLFAQTITLLLTMMMNDVQ